MIRIIAPHFCAGVILQGGAVVDTPPILAYMAGWGAGRVFGYTQSKGWQAALLIRGTR